MTFGGTSLSKFRKIFDKNKATNEKIIISRLITKNNNNNNLLTKIKIQHD